LTGLFIGSR